MFRYIKHIKFGPRRDKTCPRGFRQSETQTILARPGDTLSRYVRAIVLPVCDNGLKPVSSATETS